MRAGLAVSVVGHLLVIAWGVITLHSFDPLETPIEALPVELVEIEDVSSIPEGQKSAEKAPKPAPNDPAKTAAKEPDPAPVPSEKPGTAPPPPPPESAATEAESTPEPASKPEEAAAAEPAPATEPLPETATADPRTPPPEPVPQAPKPPEEKTEPKPTVTAAAVPSPRVRPKPPVLAAAPPTPEKAETFSTDEIRALLDKSEPKATPAPSDATASLGVRMAAASESLTQNELDTLRAQVQRCWNIPMGWTDPREVSVTVRFRLNQDGTVNGTPVVIEFPASQYGQVSADNAIRAVLRCGPYQLPPEKFDQWSEVQIRFTPLG